MPLRNPLVIYTLGPRTYNMVVPDIDLEVQIMKFLRNPLIIAAVILLVFVALGAGTYNSLVSRNEAIDAQWAQVEVQLQRRFDLIPNLVETVKGYMEHEQEIFDKITEARAKLANARTVTDQVQAANELESALSRLLVLAEDNPELKADRQFTALMDELAGTENRIAVERRRYNEAVREFNTAIKRFPTNIFARIFGFTERIYLESTDGADTPPSVNFEN